MVTHKQVQGGKAGGAGAFRPIPAAFGGRRDKAALTPYGFGIPLAGIPPYAGCGAWSSRICSAGFQPAFKTPALQDQASLSSPRQPAERPTVLINHSKKAPYRR